MEEYKLVRVKLSTKEKASRKKKEHEEDVIRHLGPVFNKAYLYFLSKIKKAKKKGEKYYIIKDEKDCPRNPIGEQLIKDGYYLVAEPSSPDSYWIKVWFSKKEADKWYNHKNK